MLSLQILKYGLSPYNEHIDKQRGWYLKIVYND